MLKSANKKNVKFRTLCLIAKIEFGLMLTKTLLLILDVLVTFAHAFLS